MFFEELRKRGYVEGQNLTVELYSGRGQTERYAPLAAEVVSRNPDVILTFTSRMLRHFKEATATIPVVGTTADPVVLGLVPSLARPGGNLTGVVTAAGLVIWDKRLEIVREIFPQARRVGFVVPDKFARLKAKARARRPNAWGSRRSAYHWKPRFGQKSIDASSKAWSGRMPTF